MKEKETRKQMILDIYHDYSGRPGHRMMAVFLARRNIILSKTTVLKYMQELKIRSVVTPKKPRYHKGECHKKFDNLLNRDFTADAPNRKWCTDFTYIFLSDGTKRYNCSVLDLYDKSIIATKNSVRIDAQLAVDTLRAALERTHAGENLILHSDQGSQYPSRAFTEFCEQKHIRQSMSKAGCPYDNSPMESFYGTFKAEFVSQHSFTGDEHLNNATADYVYGYYNHQRPTPQMVI